MNSLHETDEQLELFALDRLPDPAAERVEEHLLICDACRLRVGEIGDFAYTVRAALRAMPTGPVPGRPGWWQGWNLRFVMGGLAFALVLAAVTFRNGRDLQLVPVASITLSSIRGDHSVVFQPARELDVTLTGTSGTQLEVEVVDSTGSSKWKGTADAHDGNVRVRIAEKFAPGTYFVRLHSASGELLHEYGFEVHP
ncbi:MAG: hypothetical protein JWN34_1027 [Bryobacterales bacterium]|jgi:hypothetical protein|nr:hypothetical protein [Bryobacterales bacterium]